MVHSPPSNCVFLKLGGSLITEKTAVEQARPEILDRMAYEVQQARQTIPHLRLLVGHGSGSFGHAAASRYDTRDGVEGPVAWLGFAEVADAAARLNRLVVHSFLQAGVPVWSLQPSASTWCEDGKVGPWRGTLISMALQRGLVPLVYGDTLLDRERGGTIASTEELFAALVPALRPSRIILAGTVDGVYSGDPLLNRQAVPWPIIRPNDLAALGASLGQSHGTDVTGGMLSKVTTMCQLVAAWPGLQVRLVSGLRPGAISAALLGQESAGGTLITGDA